MSGEQNSRNSKKYEGTYKQAYTETYKQAYTETYKQAYTETYKQAYTETWGFLSVGVWWGAFCLDRKSVV